MDRIVVIDCFPEGVRSYREGYAVLAIDVIRATTTAVTAVAAGRECYPVASLESAWQLSAKLNNPLMVGELGGLLPEGFHGNNSPAEIAVREDISRPMILLSSTGTKLICEAEKCEAVYLSCLRNYRSTARYLVGRYPRVAIIGSVSLGEFREEDQMCCAWIAEDLMKAGYQPKDQRTADLVKHWSGVSPDAFVGNKSFQFLKESGQLKDLEFILAHVNDLQDVFLVKEGRVVRVPTEETQLPFSQ